MVITLLGKKFNIRKNKMRKYKKLKHKFNNKGNNKI
jgi:hypothetical protein